MEAPQRNDDKSGANSQEGEVFARLLCSATEIYPKGDGEDLRYCTKTFTLCLTSDGRLRTDDEGILTWYALNDRRTVVRTDEGGWRGVCSSDGHVTLEASGSLPKSEAQTTDRLLAGRLLPPCSLAGTVADTSASTSTTGRFEITIVSVELVAGGQPAVAATWDHLLGLLKRLRAYERSQGSTTRQGGGDDGGSDGGVDFSAYLPLEAIFRVCSFLPVFGVQSLGRCSHVFHRICSDPWLWKQLYQRRFGPHTLLAPQPPAAAGNDDGAHQVSIEDLREGFSTPVAEAQSIWNHQPWPTTTPMPPGLPALVSDSDESEGVDWKQKYELAARKDSNYLSSLVVNDGLYIVDGHTRNSASRGNVTRVQGTRVRLQHGLLWAEMQYSSGSSYNRQTGAVWVGRYDRASRVIEWRERYATHSGLFHYTGRVVDHHTITGTYRWDVNGATGTFEFHLSQPEDHSRSAGGDM